MCIWWAWERIEERPVDQKRGSPLDWGLSGDLFIVHTLNVLWRFGRWMSLEIYSSTFEGFVDSSMMKLGLWA